MRPACTVWGEKTSSNRLAVDPGDCERWLWARKPGRKKRKCIRRVWGLPAKRQKRGWWC